MKTYISKKRISSELKNAIQNTLDFHEKYSNSYFWTNTGSSSYRSYKEVEFENLNPAYLIDLGCGKTISVEPSLKISSRNYYYSLNISVVDESGYEASKDIRLLKNFINRNLDYIKNKICN